jgi:long-chain acyl-CoA synthetase
MRDNSTLLHRLSLWAQDQPGQPALYFKTESSAWSSITAGDYWLSVVRIAEGLISQKVARGDRVLIYAVSSPEWMQWELGILLAGGISVGLHPHLPDRDLQSIIEQVNPKFALVPENVFRDRLNGIDLNFSDRTEKFPVYTFAEAEAKYLNEVTTETEPLLRRGEQLLKLIQAKQTQFLVFTSGTTGTPKGVMLGLSQLTYVSDVLAREWNLPFSDGSLFSFLPLAHIAEKIQSMGVAITERYPVWFNSKFENFFSEIREVRPTMLLAVPRVWERFKEQVEVQKPKLLQRVMELERLGSFAERIYLSQAKEQIGLDRLKLAVSGAVKLAPSVAEWFKGIGIEIQEIYGMSESCGLATLTHSPRTDFMMVGVAPAGVQVKISSDGEIWVKGSNLFNGYWGDEVLTQSVLMDDGWLKTGDLGEWGDELKIIGRNRDIIKLSNGRMIAPAPIENALKEIPEVSNACLVGEGKHGLLALITLKEQVLLEFKFIPGAIEGLSVEDDALNEKIRSAISDLVAQHKIAEKIPNFIILSREFSTDHHELTVTQKLNRMRIHQNFRHFIEFKFEEY